MASVRPDIVPVNGPKKLSDTVTTLVTSLASGRAGMESIWGSELTEAEPALVTSVKSALSIQEASMEVGVRADAVKVAGVRPVAL